MAVIREQRQFKIGPIGVARASEGGKYVGEALAQAGQSIADGLFKRAAEDAEKAGIDYAKSVAADQIRGIDPHTGAPVALNNLKGMGRIQAQAYERIVQARFESSIEEEIRQKSSEFAMRYEDPRAFEKAMGNHIQEMAKNATGQYSTFISEVGTIWTGRASLALQEQAINRARAAAAAAAKEQQKRLEETAYHLGASEANGDTTASGQFGAMTNAQLRLDREVRTFGGGGSDAGRAAPRLTATASKNTEANASYAAGYLMSSLVHLTNADRNAIQAQLLHNVPMAMSPAAQKVYARVREMVPSAEKLAGLGAAIKADVTSLNSNFPNMTGDFTTEYVSATNRLTAANEDNGFLHTGYQDLQKSVDIISALSSSADDADVVGSEKFNARLGQVEKAQQQAASGAIISIADSANFSAEELDAVRAGLQSRDPSALLALARAKGVPVSDETGSVLAELLSVIDKPTEALAVLESRETYLAGIDLREEQRHTEFIKNNSDAWISRVANGDLDPETIISEFGQQISKSKEYRKFVGQLGDAVHIGALRDYVSNTMLITDSEMMKEVGLLVTDSNVSTPLLKSAGFRDQIVSMLGNIKDPTVRKQVVNALQEDAPNLTVQEQRLRDQTFEKFKQLINTSSFDNQPVNQTIIARDATIATIRGNESLTESQKDSLIGELNKEAGKAIASQVIVQKVDPSRLDQAVDYVASGGASKGELTPEEMKELNKVVGPFATEADREAIAAKTRILASNRQKALAEEAQNRERDATLSAWRNGGLVDPKHADAIQNVLEAQYGVAMPRDAIMRADYYLAAAKDTSSPDYKQGLLVTATLENAGRVMLPALRSHFEAVSNGMFAGVDLQQTARLWSYAGGTAEQRSMSAAAAGFTPEQTGVLEGIAVASSYGVPTQYLDDIALSLKKPVSSKESFEIAAAKSTPAFLGEVFGKSSATVSDPSTYEFYTNYAYGLHRAGVPVSKIKETLKSHLDDAFYDDPLTTNISAPAFGKVSVGVVKAMSNDIVSTNAAVQLVQADQWAALGAQAAPHLSKRDQMVEGKRIWDEQFARFYVSNGFTGMPFGTNQKSVIDGARDLGGKLGLTFIPRAGSQNNNAIFDIFAIDQNGSLVSQPFVSSLNPRDPRIAEFAQELRNKPPSAGTFDDRVIDFWLRSKK